MTGGTIKVELIKMLDELDALYNVRRTDKEKAIFIQAWYNNVKTLTVVDFLARKKLMIENHQYGYPKPADFLLCTKGGLKEYSQPRRMVGEKEKIDSEAAKERFLRIAENKLGYKRLKQD